MLDAYCWPQSAIGGGLIEVMASGAAATCTVEVSRVGAIEELVLYKESVRLSEQPIPTDVAVNGCRWDPTLSFEVDTEWASGFYLVRLTDSSGAMAEAFFVVRGSGSADALLVLSTSTWAAYNDWGGPSFYTGGHRSSLLRPLPRGFLDKPEPERYRAARTIELPRVDARAHFDDYSPWSIAAGWANWERLFVVWAEALGMTLDYATSLDLAQDPSLLEPYRTYLSVGHDEYWSASMRDSVEGWVDGGGRALFFSGNTSFWQIRIEDGGTAIVGYKTDFELDPVVGTEAEHTVSTMWSDPLCARPETEMTGVTFTRGGYANMTNSPPGGGYRIWRPDHWIFDGLDLAVGEEIGARQMVVGYECDGCAFEVVDGLPQPTGAGGTPLDFQILGTAPAKLWQTHEVPRGLVDYVGELNWVASRLAGADTGANRALFEDGHAVMGIFGRGKGMVFTTGCTDWAYGLTDPTISAITHNLVSGM